MNAYAKRIIEMVHQRGEIAPLDDGFQRWWPSNHGAISSDDLRIIADELDRLNEPLAKSIELYFSMNPPTDVI